MQWNTILVPLDFSQDSEAALRAAIEYAKTFNAKLHLLHVFEYPTYIGTPWGYAYPPGAFSDARLHASELLSEWQAKVTAESVVARARRFPPP